MYIKLNSFVGNPAKLLTNQYITEHYLNRTIKPEYMLYCYLKRCFAAVILAMFILVGTGKAATMQDTTANARANAADMVTGNVVDDSNRPLVNVKISIKGGAESATSDTEGDFSIKAAAGSVLVLSHPNHYVNQITVKNNADTLQVRLVRSYLQKRDSVDVLYGVAKKDNLLSAVNTIYTNQLTTTPASLYVYALPGQLAGLYTQQIGGFFSTNNSNPLATFFGDTPVTVQGHNFTPTDNAQIDLAIRGQGVTTIVDGIQREISSIDPESIESISVLKDALSTVLLGVNSSKNILLVTTKKPEIGIPKISFTAISGIQESMGLPDKAALPAYQYAYLFNEALVADGRTPLYDASDIQKYQDQSSPYTHPDVNWFNALLKKTSPMKNYRLNVSGGNATARYNVALNYYNQDGIFKEDPNVAYSTNNNLSRYMINSNIGVNVTKNLTVDLQMFGRIQQVRDPGRGYTDILRATYLTPNNAYPIRNPDGSFGGSTAGDPLRLNLVARAQNSGYSLTKINDVLANVNLNYNMDNFVKGLKFRVSGNVAIQSQVFIDRSLQAPTFGYSLGDDGVTENYAAIMPSEAQRNSFAMILSSRYSFAQAALSYDRTFGKNNITAQLMYDTRSLAVSYDLEASTTNRAFKAGYNYDEKYFIEGVVNYSGYNRYAPGRQNGWFYAGGLGWHMGKESFIKDNLDFINSWKWRLSYGRTGNNNVGYYVYKQTYILGGLNDGVPRYPLGTVTPRNDGDVNGNGGMERGLANPLISWEKANKLNIGADISLFKDHLQITADYFRDKYFDLLGKRGSSITILGAAYPDENIGINIYKGTEFTVTYRNNISNFNYFISGNISTVASERAFFDEQIQKNPFNARTGQPVNAIYGYINEGFFTDADIQNNAATINGYNAQPGDLKYKDMDGNGVIDQYDQTAIGNLKPLTFFGVSLGFNYKAFSFSAIIQGVTNRDILYKNGLMTGFEGLNTGFGAPNPPYGQAYSNITNRWTPETAASALYPRLSLAQVSGYTFESGSNQSANSTFYIKSGNYIRLKNVEIGYTLPITWVRAISLSGVRLFVNGENLYTIAGFRGYDGMDPEVFGVGAYPLQRVVSAGVTVKL